MKLEKLTSLIFLLALIFIVFQYFNFEIALAQLYDTNPEEATKFFQRFSQNVFLGNLISTLLLLICNITAYFTKKPQWLFLPLIFFAIAHILNAIEGEHIFTYKKATNLWDGSFSLGLIGAFILIALAAMVIFINYLVLKYILRKRSI